ncbi:MAG: hypothetical protein ACI4OI_04810 [Gemmiger sp.]
MKTKLSKVCSFLLAVCAALSCLPLGVWAEEPDRETVHIATAEELILLAENCRLDSWSQHRTVVLDADLDVSGTEFAGIPTFGGVFQGQHHTISGFRLSQAGSVQGLFRYVQEGGEVYDLTVTGAVTPEGSRSTVGGIAGVNAGLLQNVCFSGVVSGADVVGGIAGRNEVTGVIEDCDVRGIVYGSHFIGGVAGENHGVVRNCENNAGVNTTVQQNEVSVSDITMDSLTGAETVTDTTDVGGIAGVSSGVLRACVNRATVGYRHMGYNIGGIVGSQTGYVEGCVNFGSVFARKEAGGIVGQLEPSSTLQYRMDTLQTLSRQLSVLQGLTDKAAADAEAAGSELSAQLTGLQSQVSSARGAVIALLEQTANGVSIGTQTVTTDLTPLLDDLEQRIKDSVKPELSAGEAHDRPVRHQPGEEGPSALPTPAAEPSPAPAPSAAPNSEISVTVPTLVRTNEDNILAARNDLSGSLDGLSQSVSALNSAGSSSASALGSDLRAITAQIGRISQTLADAGNRSDEDVVEDISDADTDSDTEGKIYNCVNAGTVQADLNAGGIAGAMAMENDLDPEDDVTVSGEVSANVTYRTRAVVRGCDNRGTVTAKKQCAGGIVGSMELGSVLECVNTGLLDAESAEYVGGIAGSSSKTVRGCAAKCVVRGGSKVGGIAGSGVNLQDNRAMVRLADTAAEWVGAIAGTTKEESSGGLFRQDTQASGDASAGVTGNYFVPNDTAPAAIDGVNYEGKAQALPYEDFIALEGIQEVFRTLTVRFVAETTEVQVFSLAYGDALDRNSLPEVPVKAGYTGRWAGLDETDLSCLTFDETFTAEYTPLSTAQASGVQRKDGRPVALLEGSFASDDALTLTASEEQPAPAPGETWLESWSLGLPVPVEQTQSAPSRLHYLPPEEADQVQLYLHSADGWRKASAETDGSYLVVELHPGDDMLAAARQAPAPLPFAAVGGAAAVLAVVLLVHCRRKHRAAANS